MQTSRGETFVAAMGVNLVMQCTGTSAVDKPHSLVVFVGVTIAQSRDGNYWRLVNNNVDRHQVTEAFMIAEHDSIRLVHQL
jgi:hypothetical protein